MNYEKSEKQEYTFLLKSYKPLDSTSKFAECIPGNTCGGKHHRQNIF